MEQLLIIEDDIGLNQGLSKALKADDRQIISCHDLKAAREQLLCGSVSLILLDINLPDGKMCIRDRITHPSTRSFIRFKDFRSVDLPQPLGPIKAVISFSGIAMFIFFSA